MRSRATSLTLAAALLPAAASAVPTPTADFSASLPGTTVAAQPELAGIVIEDRMVPFSVPASWGLVASGRVQVRTVRGPDGRLTFTWRIFSDRSSTVPIQSLEILGFPRMPYDANWRRDVIGTIAPSRVSGEALSGWRMKFVFLSPNAIAPGAESRFFFLRSSATASRPAGIRIWTGHASSPVLLAAGPAS